MCNENLNFILEKSNFNIFFKKAKLSMTNDKYGNLIGLSILQIWNHYFKYNEVSAKVLLVFLKLNFLF